MFWTYFNGKIQIIRNAFEKNWLFSRNALESALIFKHKHKIKSSPLLILLDVVVTKNNLVTEQNFGFISVCQFKKAMSIFQRRELLIVAST